MRIGIVAQREKTTESKDHFFMICNSNFHLHNATNQPKIGNHPTNKGTALTAFTAYHLLYSGLDGGNEVTSSLHKYTT